MRAFGTAIAAVVLLAGVARAQEPRLCDVPAILLATEYKLAKVSAAVRKNRRLDVIVIGSASSAVAGPGGAEMSYPAQLEDTLRTRLPGVEVKVVSHAKARQTAAHMAESLEKILLDDKPTLVIWQTGTVDAIRGVDQYAFQSTLEDGVTTLQTGGADVILMNAQYSPRTESMIALDAYLDSMRWVSQERAVPLFDRFAIMRHWNDIGAFNFYGASRDFALARKVHHCIGRALAAQVIEAAQLESVEPGAAR